MTAGASFFFVAIRGWENKNGQRVIKSQVADVTACREHNARLFPSIV
jgi:hypothetical protein